MDDLTALKAQSAILDRLEKTAERLRAMTAERDAALAELAALKAQISACFRCHADKVKNFTVIDFATGRENLKPGWYALYPVPALETEEEDKS